MSRTLRDSVWSAPGSTARGALRVAVLALSGLLAVSCGSAASGNSANNGTLVGYVEFGGGPGGVPDKNGNLVRRKLGGPVTVFDSHGRVIARTTVHTGQQFHFTLPPGHYRLNSGTRIFDIRYGCHAVSATVRTARTIHVDVSAGCSIP